MKAGATATYRIVQDGLSDGEAFDLEISTIAASGPLWNTLSGGQGLDSEHAKARWATPKIRAKYLAALNAPGKQEQRRASAALQWADDGARAKASEVARERWSDPQVRERQTERIKASRTSAVRAKSSARQKQLWSDPEFKAQQSERIKAALAKKPKEERVAASRANWASRSTEDREAYGRRISEGQRASKRFKDAIRLCVENGNRARGLAKSWEDPEVRKRRIDGLKRSWAKRKATDQC